MCGCSLAKGEQAEGGKAKPQNLELWGLFRSRLSSNSTEVRRGNGSHHSLGTWYPLSHGKSGIGLTFLGFIPHPRQLHTSLTCCSVKFPSPLSFAVFLILFKPICIFPFVLFLDFLTQSPGLGVQQPGGREKEGLETPTQNLMGSSSSCQQVCSFITQKPPQKLLLPTAHAGGWKWANPGQFKHCPFSPAASWPQAWPQQEVASFPSPWAAPSGTGPPGLCHHLR